MENEIAIKNSGNMAFVLKNVDDCFQILLYKKGFPVKCLETCYFDEDEALKGLEKESDARLRKDVIEGLD